jgi:hypothetical protein
MKIKASKEQIDLVKSSVYYKIFDVLKINDVKYYLDREFNLIWNEDKIVVGIINKDINLFFTDIDKLIEEIKVNY